MPGGIAASSAALHSSGVTLGDLMLALVLAGFAALQGLDVESAPGGRFCQRMAADLGMRAPPPLPAAQVWALETVHGLKGFFGGARTIAIRVALDDADLTVENIKRHANDCSAEPHGGFCRIDGPVIFNMTIGGEQKRYYRAYAGERAMVRVIDTRI